MSSTIDINTLSDIQKEKIHNDLQIKLIDNKYNKFAPPRFIYAYELNENILKVPFAYAYQNLKMSRPSRSLYSIMNTKFQGSLRDEQKLIKKEVIDILNKTGSAILSAYVGFGKTITSINICCTIKLKTLIIVNKLVLIKQWKESIIKFCPTAVIQCLNAKSTMEESDFYIMNAINIPKLSKSFFKNIGCVIVDEAHLLMAERLSCCMNYIQPRYLIGLSATPYRPDGLNILLDLYFGKEKVIRELWHEHLVYQVDTKFKPKIETTNNGKLNWSVVLDSQSKDETRNNLIINIVKKFSDRIFLILVKRVEQGHLLLEKFKIEGEHVTSLLGSNQDFDIDARILIGTSSKIGVGFDHPRLDCLLLAADVEEYFIQYIGRVMRRKDVLPIIFDLVDDHAILKKHFNTRKQVYKKHGGEIKNLEL